MSSSRNGSDQPKSDRFRPVFSQLATVLKMVDEGNRDVAVLSESLQVIINKKQGWPGYKNWPEICLIGKENKNLMIVLSQVKTPPVSEIDRSLVAVFPQCFSSEPVGGPVPLSVLQARSQELAKASQEDFGEYPEEHLFLTDALDSFAVPSVTVGPIDGDTLTDKPLPHPELERLGIPVTGHDYNPEYFGKIVEFQGIDMVVLDTFGWNCVCLVPVWAVLLDA